LTTHSETNITLSELKDALPVVLPATGRASSVNIATTSFITTRASITSEQPLPRLQKEPNVTANQEPFVRSLVMPPSSPLHCDARSSEPNTNVNPPTPCHIISTPSNKKKWYVVIVEQQMGIFNDWYVMLIPCGIYISKQLY
jgi:hypothetical protein